MEISTAQHQEFATNSLEDMMVSQKTQQDQRKPRPQPEQALNCPRCDSTNTKFCYYNNYSLSQPRYFCKSCRRYWTKGGTLRNVPVGGGCRKNKKSSSSSSSKRSQDHQSITPNSTNFSPYDHSNDLSLAFSGLQRISCGQIGYSDFDPLISSNFNIVPKNNHSEIAGNNGIIANSNTNHGLIDTIRSGILEGQNGNFSYMYYHGFGNGNIGEVENGGVVLPCEEFSSNEISTPAVTVTTTKQEVFGSQENERIFWGFPNWQVNGDGNVMAGEVGSGKDSWNGINSSWHGLLNSPLM